MSLRLTTIYHIFAIFNFRNKQVLSTISKSNKSEIHQRMLSNSFLHMDQQPSKGDQKRCIFYCDSCACKAMQRHFSHPPNHISINFFSFCFKFFGIVYAMLSKGGETLHTAQLQKRWNIHCSPSAILGLIKLDWLINFTCFSSINYY